MFILHLSLVQTDNQYHQKLSCLVITLIDSDLRDLSLREMYEGLGFHCYWDQQSHLPNKDNRLYNSC